MQPKALFDCAVSVLTHLDYLILERTKNALSFKDDPWQIQCKSKIFSKVDQGMIEFVPFENGSKIILTYYISFVPEFIITSILTVLSITQSHYIVLIALPLLIQLFIRIGSLKTATGEMMSMIIN